MKKTLFLLVVTALLSVNLIGCSSNPFVPDNDLGSKDETKSQELPKKVQVKVVDKSYRTNSFVSNGDSLVTTHYLYDDCGKLLTMTDSCDNPTSSINLCQTSFEYDSQNRVAEAEMAYEQYQWEVGRRETYIYDDNGFCIEFLDEIRSQGDGSHHSVLTIDGDGKVLTENVTSTIRSGLTSKNYDCDFNYFDNDLIKDVTSTEDYLNYYFDQGRSDIDAGLYSYSSSNLILLAYYDDDLNMVKLVEKTPYGEETTEFIYKTIIVDSGKYVPSIYSNPQCFSSGFKPSLTRGDVERIMDNA